MNSNGSVGKLGKLEHCLKKVNELKQEYCFIDRYAGMSLKVRWMLQVIIAWFKWDLNYTSNFLYSYTYI